MLIYQLRLLYKQYEAILNRSLFRVEWLFTSKSHFLVRFRTEKFILTPYYFKKAVS